jgi:hypothetical protein
MWTRDVSRRNGITSFIFSASNPKAPPIKVKRTDFWFNHYCAGFEFKKIKGKVRPHKPIRGQHRYEDGFLIRHCQACGAKMDTEVQDYFSKALELWRLSADPN